MEGLLQASQLSNEALHSLLMRDGYLLETNDDESRVKIKKKLFQRQPKVLRFFLEVKQALKCEQDFGRSKQILWWISVRLPALIRRE